MKCDGWEITTTEGIGSREDGYDLVQAALATESGTQCGFCSPGMVMAMHRYKGRVYKATMCTYVPLKSCMIAYENVAAEI